MRGGDLVDFQVVSVNANPSDSHVYRHVDNNDTIRYGRLTWRSKADEVASLI